MRVAGRVAEGGLSLEVQRSKRTVDPTTGEISLLMPTGSAADLEDGIKLEVRPSDGGGLIAAMEFSVPRVLRGDNVTPADPGGVVSAVERMHERAGKKVRWLVDPPQMTLRRLDIARDFTNVPRPQELLGLLLRTSVSRCTPSAYLARDGIGAQTVYRETERWTTRLYARGPQYDDRARTASRGRREELGNLAERERSTVRFEVQLNGGALRSAGVRTVSDLTNEWLWAQARHYFHRARHHVTVGGGALALQAAMVRALATHSASKVAGALLESYCASHGVRAYSPNAAAEHLRNAEAWGIGIDQLATQDGPEVRLDFDSGTLCSARDAA